MGKAIAGTAYLSVDSVQHLLRGEFTYDPTLVERETIAGMDGIHGFSEKPTHGSIKGTITDYGNFPVSTFNGMTNVTVTVELINGKVIVGRNMWTVGRVEVNGTEGSFPVEWQGTSVQEIVTP